ncbi:SDR family NAD(P)-dependent oxidoreductase [Paenibacillus wenxiniae]|uniref:SDR family NAD(P)-dependent oxidoreductase n=1 Tax=Paenibacillus wenxiniae TaxID=1636843 RepID=A0ABW4RFX5_9BACL
MPTHPYTACITGANAGIGLELTRKLLHEGWQVIAINRSEFPTDDTHIQQATQSRQLRPYTVTDLADYDSLRTVLHQIQQQEQQIDVLFNNAGRSFSELSYSRQGRELHYELMTVVPYIILMELRQLLQRSTLRTVINTSSSAFQFTRSISNDTLKRPQRFRKLIGPYASSKLALSLWTKAAAPSFANEGILLRSVDPGGNNTLRKGKNSGLPLLVKPLMKLFFPPPTHGAEQLYQGAIGIHRDQRGVFISKGKIAKLKFSDQAQEIWQQVQAIYEQEYKVGKVTLP